MMTSYTFQGRQISTCYLTSQTPMSETPAPQDASGEAGTDSWHFPDPWVGAVGSSAQPRKWGQRRRLLLFFPVLLSRGRGGGLLTAMCSWGNHGLSLNWRFLKSQMGMILPVWVK